MKEYIKPTIIYKEVALEDILLASADTENVWDYVHDGDDLGIRI